MAKGSIGDIFFWMVILVVIGICFLVALLLKTNLLDPINSMLSPQAQEVMNTAETGFLSFDSMFAIIAVGMGLASVLLAYLIRSVLPMMIFAILIAVIALVVMPVMSNSFRGMATAPQMESATESLPMTRFIMANLPMFGLAISVLIIIVVYGKMRGG